MKLREILTDEVIRRVKGLNLFYLRYFVTLAHVRHYTKAAEHLCITQPSLSHAIMQLEKELGVPLFEKTGRNTALTPFGREFLRCAEHTLSVLDEGGGSTEEKRTRRGIDPAWIFEDTGGRFYSHDGSRFFEGTSHRGSALYLSYRNEQSVDRRAEDQTV